jgi:hypothetical protein
VVDKFTFRLQWTIRFHFLGGEEWTLEMERNIDRNGSSKPRAVRNVRTFGDLIDLHDEDMREVGKPSLVRGG